MKDLGPKGELTLVFMAPRLLVSLGALVALRCGIFNLGGEGQLQLGAVGAVLPATLLPASWGILLLPLSLLSGALFGALWGLSRPCSRSGAAPTRSS